MSFLSGLDHGENGQGGHRGVHAFLSGIHNKNAKAFKEQNISVDQKAVQFAKGKTRYNSMQLATNADSGNRLSWSSAGVALPAETNLDRIYAALFQQYSQAERSLLEETYRKQKSVLDLVQGDAKRLHKKVSVADRDKIDQYFTSIRDVEKSLGQSEAWLNKDKPKVDYQLPKGAQQFDLVEKVPLFYQLLTLALQTDSTRIATLALTGLGPNLGGLPITMGYHQLTHHGKEAIYLKELTVIEKFHTEQFGKFIGMLDEVKEQEGHSLLDNCQVLLGSGLGNASSHSNKNLPLLLVGGGYKHGQHHHFKKDKSKNGTLAANLYTSMLQEFGLEIDKFNLASGTLTGIEKA